MVGEGSPYQQHWFNHLQATRRWEPRMSEGWSDTSFTVARRLLTLFRSKCGYLEHLLTAASTGKYTEGTRKGVIETVSAVGVTGVGFDVTGCVRVCSGFG